MLENIRSGFIEVTMSPDRVSFISGHLKTTTCFIASNINALRIMLTRLREIFNPYPNAEPMESKAPYWGMGGVQSKKINKLNSQQTQPLSDQNKATEYHLLKNFVEAFTNNRPPQLLLFGDSVSFRVATDDQSLQSFGEILGTHYQEDCNFFLVSGSGYHSDIYEQFCTVLAELPSRPCLAVLPINLRSFSPTWDLNPLYQFRNEIELLTSFKVNSQNYELPDIERYSEKTNRVVLFPFPGEPTITLHDFLEIVGRSPPVATDEWVGRLKIIFQYHYGCPISPKHRKIQSLKRTIQLLNRLGVAVYSYFTPINYEAGMEYCGKHFIDIVRNNISQIRQELQSASASSSGYDARLLQLDDFTFQFSRHFFFTSHNATEHLRFEGRNFIVKRIVEAHQSLIKYNICQKIDP